MLQWFHWYIGSVGLVRVLRFFTCRGVRVSTYVKNSKTNLMFDQSTKNHVHGTVLHILLFGSRSYVRKKEAHAERIVNNKAVLRISSNQNSLLGGPQPTLQSMNPELSTGPSMLRLQSSTQGRPAGTSMYAKLGISLPTAGSQWASSWHNTDRNTVHAQGPLERPIPDHILPCL